MTHQHHTFVRTNFAFRRGIQRRYPHARTGSKFPTMTFVLDHLGHNSSGEDFDTWAPAITALVRTPVTMTHHYDSF